jgi:mannosyltransferase
VSTSTRTERRPWSSIIGLPPIRDIGPPGWIARRPTWLVATVSLAILLLIALYLHTGKLGQELWFNEAIATGIADQSFGGVLHAVHDGGSAPLYYLLLHFWVNGFGDGESSVRALSLICSLLAVPAAGWVGWSIAGPRGALYAAVLFTFSSYLTQFSQQAQPYTLMLLLSVLAIGGFIEGFVHRRRRYLWLLGIALEAALYTQLMAAVLMFGLGVALAVLVWLSAPELRRGLIVDGVICFGAVLVFFVPWLPATISQIAHATSPWHYTANIGADVPEDLLGGERVDAAFVVGLVVGIVPLLVNRDQRRGPLALTIYALLAATVAAFAVSKLSEVAAAGWVYRYFAPMVALMLLLSAVGCARAGIVGFIAVLLIVPFNFDPGSFAPSHMSDMQDIAGEMTPLLHRGDVVALGQPEQTPLADYYLPSGLSYTTTMGHVSNVQTMDWMNALSRLQDNAPGPAVKSLVASLKPGQQLLFVRPLTEGVQNWASSWPQLVRRRSAQWGQILAEDVADGTLTAVARAPHSYPSACCVASSAILYRKAS